ncbi:autotransporter outer membrane beta-barrel domain-containing protein [Puniceicoccus vermicola]|nr:hypothetical protein [Puniceicoccus vermicola]
MSKLAPIPFFSHLFPLLAFGISLVCLPVHSAVVTLDADDSGNSSFATAGNWDDNQAPQAGNDYYTNGFRLEVPNDNNDYTFGGDSLTINNSNWAVIAGTTRVLTVNDLILDNANLQTGTSGRDLNLDGNVTVAGNSSLQTIRASVNFLAAVGGSAELRIYNRQAANDPTVTFLSSANTFTGDIDVDVGHFTLADNARMNFVIGASSGVNNEIYDSSAASSTSIVDLDGDFYFDLSSASTTQGDFWNIVDLASLGASNVTFGETFSVNGFSNSGTLWTSGYYAFDESTGTLSVIPEPSSATMILLAGCGVTVVVCGRRRSVS